MIYYSITAFVTGYLLDLIFGDPYWLPHPIRLIGTLISKTEKWIRRFCKNTQKSLMAGGTVLVILILTFSTLIPLTLLNFLYHNIPLLGFIVESIMCYQILATKCLKVESMRVYHSLVKGDLKEARYNVSMIVGRDTADLDEAGVTRAAVETVAENTSDGVIAPMIYLAIGGPVLGFFYKAVNTMDSMIGYKNESYLYFGRVAARLDDFVNYLPARISAYLMILVCPLTGLDFKAAVRIYRRDKQNHASPNSAQTEAVCAGALGLQLAGDAFYFGKLYKKPTIGDDTRPIEAEDIKRVNKLLYAASFLAVVLFTILKLVCVVMFIK
ncbi:adenosylcobinamide-phosphate synthase CbiB [Anaerocolumna sp. MB42-C2]|uniref:adenosylcobinamide-phosphate synthase CbiB n=1 Tax=Anaerocolumna sp. MB42-C2 TaxID=3070997 RepID=UPI0027E04F44|nr:adenosylcobinamide-phosphate synthase CbiB [Anaerocolumna sp. MB42-C2]WMJ89523.1 adenosylcobinamide-phosphate synthase CbiB [Anaerocolumna sp. MB42-C2]